MASSWWDRYGDAFARAQATLDGTLPPVPSVTLPPMPDDDEHEEDDDDAA